jgi:hypothetical protein
MTLGLRLGLSLSLLAVGCVSAREARFALDAARLERARELSVEERAPDLYARALKARDQAGKLPEESPARGDYASEARLWLEASIAEAERLSLSEKRLVAERELLAAEQALVQAERARAEATRAVEVQLAAEIAREEAKKALERANQATRLRPKLSRAEVMAASDALLARATLVHAALPALGVDAAKHTALGSELGEARAAVAKDPDAALDRAHALLDRTLALLATLRAKSGAASEAEAASLAEALREAGLRVTRGDRGLAAVLEGAFAERLLKPATRPRLARICELSRAHPHGAVRAAVGSANAAVASARSRELAAELSRAGCDAARVGVDVAALGSDDVEITWLAY